MPARRGPWISGGPALDPRFPIASAAMAAAATGASLSFAGALVVATLASLLRGVSITPAGLGITEAGSILLLRPPGLNPVTAGTIAASIV